MGKVHCTRSLPLRLESGYFFFRLMMPHTANERGTDFFRSLEIGSSIVSYRGEIIGMPQMEFRD